MREADDGSDDEQEGREDWRGAGEGRLEGSGWATVWERLSATFRGRKRSSKLRPQLAERLQSIPVLSTTTGTTILTKLPQRKKKN